MIHQVHVFNYFLPFFFFVSPIIAIGQVHFSIDAERERESESEWQNDIYGTGQNIVEAVIAFDKDITPLSRLHLAI